MILYNRIYPCKDCPDRKLNCHSCCEDYKRAKASYDEIKEVKKHEADVEDFIIKSIAKKTNNSKKIYMQRRFIGY